MKSQSGNMVLLLFLLLGMAGLGGGVYWANRGSESVEKTVDPRAAFELARDRVQIALGNPRVLNSSVERNPNAFSCFYTGNANCQNGGGSFILYEGVDNSSPALSQLRRDNGLAANGLGCRGFPNPLCPVRVEVEWKPVCAQSGPCENTRSGTVHARVLLNDGEHTEEWTKDTLLTPTIKLSAAATCERGGGTWAITECLSPEQAAQRAIASRDGAVERLDSQKQALPRPEEGSTPAPAPAESPRVDCEKEIVLQGQVYQLVYTAENRAQAAVPAMNGCPAEDVFTFQCQPKSPDDPYGQWIQIEAKMAPSCEQPLEPQNVNQSFRQ